MAAVTADEWRPILMQRLDERSPRIRLLRQYQCGDAPPPEMGDNTREAWKRFQRKARTNMAELIVEALADRIVFNGVAVGDAGEDDDRARRIIRENRLEVVIPDVARDMFATSIAYMIVGRDPETGRPVVTGESPDFVYASTDPLRPWISRAVVKVWRDLDEKHDYAYVWANGERVKYSRPSFDQNPDGSQARLIGAVNAGSWARDGDPEAYVGDPPVVVFENHGGTGEFEPHIDLIDRINLGILQRMVTVSMQAFRQRALKGGLPEDQDGDDVDWAKVFEPAPGALWDLPEGVDIWESQDASAGITAMLNAVKDDIRDLAAVTRTPSALLMPDEANQSAEGAAFAREGLVFKARDRVARLRVGLSEVLRLAIQVEDSQFSEVVEAQFAPVDAVSQTEKYAAMVQAKAADVPWRTRMSAIGGFSADVIDQMEGELAQEALIGGLSEPGNTAPAGPTANNV